MKERGLIRVGEVIACTAGQQSPEGMSVGGTMFLGHLTVLPLPAEEGSAQPRRLRCTPGSGSCRGLGQVSRSVVLLFSHCFVTPSFPGHPPGLSVVPVAFLIMSDKLLQFIQL